jgi:DNA polymerase-4
MEEYSNNIKELKDKLIELFENSYDGKMIRLIGVKLSNFTKNQDYQLSIFNINDEDNQDDLENMVDEINQKFGSNVIGTVSEKMEK